MSTVGPGSYDTDTSGMGRVHRIVEDALASASAYVGSALTAPKAAAVASFYENLLDYVRAHHCAEDDVLYPLLEARCVDDRESIQLIRAQHRLQDDPMSAADVAVSQWGTDRTDDNAANVVSTLTGLLTVFSPHCRDEESIILPLAKRYVSTEEWHEMLARERQSYTLDKPWLMMGLTLEQCDEEQRRGLLARMPEARRTQWTTEWSDTYRTFMAAVRP